MYACGILAPKSYRAGAASTAAIEAAETNLIQEATDCLDGMAAPRIREQRLTVSYRVFVEKNPWLIGTERKRSK